MSAKACGELVRVGAGEDAPVSGVRTCLYQWRHTHQPTLQVQRQVTTDGVGLIGMWGSSLGVHLKDGVVYVGSREVPSPVPITPTHLTNAMPSNIRRRWDVSSVVGLGVGGSLRAPSSRKMQSAGHFGEGGGGEEGY
jgi:hypothetical protein